MVRYSIAEEDGSTSLNLKWIRVDPVYGVEIQDDNLSLIHISAIHGIGKYFANLTITMLKLVKYISIVDLYYISTSNAIWLHFGNIKSIIIQYYMPTTCF